MLNAVVHIMLAVHTVQARLMFVPPARRKSAREPVSGIILGKVRL